MKVTSLAVALALALSVSAAPQKGDKENAKAGNNNAAAGAKVGANGAGGLTAKTGAAGAANNNTAAAGNGKNAAAAAGNNADAQKSTTLDPKVIASGFANNGQDVPAAGQVASLTSTNNFINFCLTVPNLPLTDGKQITTGSCNPAPMGAIPSSDNMPSSKFTNPKNGDTLKENTPFTISMAIQKLQTGAFVNAQENYFSAPQQLNGQGQIIGHSHVVVEQLTALDQTTPTDPKKFAFFKGLNAAAQGGVLTADVTAGLPAGVYKLSSINTAANHQPVLVPIAQHGSLDDAVYFTITASGAAAAGAGAAGNATKAAGGAAAASSTAGAVPTGAKAGAAAGGKNIADGAAGGIKRPAATAAAGSKNIADGAAGGVKVNNGATGAKANAGAQGNAGAQAANNKAGNNNSSANSNKSGGSVGGGRNGRRMSRRRL